jgi:two-component system response regulator YesN
MPEDAESMYRFLMVDDEEIVRRGFEAKIDWEGEGFEFLPPCENGREAMLAIDELHPDVVMTDIHMPHADGITVAAHVMERHPEIVVVILSGYDDFNYAQAAIRNKVFDYVLKPVSSRELAVLLAKIRGKLDSDRRSRDDESALKERADRSGDLLRARGLGEFVSGLSAAPSEPEAAEILGFDPRPFACAAIVVELDREPPGSSASAPAERDEQAETLSQLLERALRQARRSAAFFPAEGRGAALVFEGGVERCAEAAAAVASALLERPPDSRAAARAEGGLLVGVGRAYAQWIDAPRSFAEAESALAYRIVRDCSQPFVYVQAGEDREALAELKSREARLCLAVSTGAVKRVAELARAYIGVLGRAELSPQRVRHEALALFSRARDELAGIGVSSAILSAKLAVDYYRFAESLASPEAVTAALVRLSEVAAGTLEASSLHEPEWKILDFKEFIARHYADKGLSLGKTAERLSISESYLSKLLRRRLGTSFVDYISEYRIDRAKELLASSDMMVYEVAEAVGYPDARYFASLFKKRTGSTTSEYRKSLGRGEGR